MESGVSQYRDREFSYKNFKLPKNIKIEDINANYTSQVGRKESFKENG
ncbi:hypothetical protein [Aequorivita lipolytica]|nr:hypothetical protein [Aequorivita lipolytica]SRX53567.1 hypothetical protein AEQU2_02799 [Aequorivita lipolytica]